MATQRILDYLAVPEDKRSLAEATLLSHDDQVMGDALDNANAFVAFPKIDKHQETS